MSAGILILITGNWNRWVGDRTWQSTDDAYVQADLTPLSTKVAGLVATVAVSDYQPVKAGDLLGSCATTISGRMSSRPKPPCVPVKTRS